MGVHPVKSCLLIAITNFIIVLYFLSTCRKTSNNYYGNIAPTVLQIREKFELDDTFPIVFYHIAYIDYRYTPPRLRVFSMNPCVTPKEYINAEVMMITKKDEKSRTKRVKLRGEPTEGECPWHWASQCFYNSFIWSAELEEEDDKDERAIKQIHIQLSNHTVALKAREVHKKRSVGFTVCVQPVYWYSEFHNIALFIESWRAQGANRFIVYFHSSTKEVRMILEYYQRMGLVDIKSWPSFGNLPLSIGTHQLPSFDSSTYRVGHTLAQNLCVLEMRSELGAIADFDEVMVPKNGTLKEYAEQEMRNVGVGALRFNHVLVKFEPRIATMDYSGLLNPIFLDRNGPSKTVFNSSVVDIIVTHSIRKFIGNETSVMASGSLLHYRHNSYTENSTQVERNNLKFFPSNADFYSRKVEKTIRNVFGANVQPYNSTFLHVLNECISKIVGEGKCRSTVSYCSRWMEPLTQWIYDKSDGVFLV